MTVRDREKIRRERSRWALVCIICGLVLFVTVVCCSAYPSYTPTTDQQQTMRDAVAKKHKTTVTGPKQPTIKKKSAAKPDARVISLEKRVRDLERRIEKLEEQLLPEPKK